MMCWHCRINGDSYQVNTKWTSSSKIVAVDTYLERYFHLLIHFFAIYQLDTATTKVQ